MISTGHAEGGIYDKPDSSSDTWVRWDNNFKSQRKERKGVSERVMGWESTA
jgi:hypothetical protein